MTERNTQATSAVIVTEESGPSRIIISGEAGGDARPCDVGRIRRIARDADAAGLPVYIWRLGSRPRITGRNDDWPAHVTRSRADADGCQHTYELGLRSSDGSDPDEWPDDLRVRQSP